MSKFSVREVAVVAEWATPGNATIKTYIGADVLVVEVIVCTDYGFNYVVRAVDGQRLECGEAALRKKRPPQDWGRLCKLHEVRRPAPKEVA